MVVLSCCGTYTSVKVVVATITLTCSTLQEVGKSVVSKGAVSFNNR